MTFDGIQPDKVPSDVQQFVRLRAAYSVILDTSIHVQATQAHGEGGTWEQEEWTEGWWREWQSSKSSQIRLWGWGRYRLCFLTKYENS